MISDLVPHLGELVDDVAFIHSLTSKTNTHGPAEEFSPPVLSRWVSQHWQLADLCAGE